MQNIVLTVHLILAALLIGVVLLQRSEGGGLGMGGAGGVMTGRQAANALTRATWLLATGFLITSVVLTLIAARGAGTGSVMDRFGGSSAPASQPASNLPNLPAYVPPPGAGQPVTPPMPSATGTAAPAATTAPAATAPAPATPAPAPTTSASMSAPPAPTTTQTAPAAQPGTIIKTVPITDPTKSN